MPQFKREPAIYFQEVVDQFVHVLTPASPQKNLVLPNLQAKIMLVPLAAYPKPHCSMIFYEEVFDEPWRTALSGAA